VTAGALAVGSGAFLVGKDYGDPFADGIGATCTAFKSATKGPCHSNTYNRKDVSDGPVGLPTRFELLVVDTSCKPIPNAIVEIWYASPAGAYSRAAEAIDSGSDYVGSASDLNVGFCTGNDGDALASNWLRGFQTSGANGRVTIDKHGSYSARGDKDTTNARDNVFASLSANEAMMAFAQQSDGALVCWKAITIA
jgi:hypothetical protein